MPRSASRPRSTSRPSCCPASSRRGTRPVRAAPPGARHAVVTAHGRRRVRLGHDVVTLSIGRALIGLGLSVALIVRLQGQCPLLADRAACCCSTRVMMTFGGLGAAMATRPVQWLLVDLDWRQIFLGLGAITVAVALYQLFAAPAYERGGKGRLGDELRGLAGVPHGHASSGVAGLAPTPSLGVWVCYASFGGGLAARCRRISTRQSVSTPRCSRSRSPSYRATSSAA